MITTNQFILFLDNTLAMVLSALGAVGLGGLIAILARRRKKQKEAA